MARIDNLTNFLTDVAAAIKNKTGDQTDIPAKDFDDHINNIPTGGGGGDTDVYRVTTIEERDAITTAKEGDLCIVYANTSGPISATSEFQTCTFPETVVLPTALTDYVEVRFRAVDPGQRVDCWGQLDSGMLNANFMTGNPETDLRISYSSNDGITYTRNDYSTGAGNAPTPFDFGTPIKYEMPEMWNDALGYFFLTGNVELVGIYTYTEGAWADAPTQFNAVADELWKDKKALGASVITGTLGAIASPELNDNTYAKLNELASLYANMPVCHLDPSGRPGTNTPLQNTEKYKNLKGIIANPVTGAYMADLSLFDLNNVTSGFQPGNCTYGLFMQNGDAPICMTGLDTTGVKNFEAFHANNYKLQAAAINLNDAVTIRACFAGCRALKNIKFDKAPNVIGPNCKDMRDAFLSCYNIELPEELFPALGHVEKIENAFKSCRLPRVVNIDLSSVTDSTFNLFGTAGNVAADEPFEELNIIAHSPSMNHIGHLCSGHKNLKRVTGLETINLTNGGCQDAFSGCTSLEEVCPINITGANNAYGLFRNCTSLRKVDLSPCTLTSDLIGAAFYKVPVDCLIYVKDQASKDAIQASRRNDSEPEMTNIQIKP